MNEKLKQKLSGHHYGVKATGINTELSVKDMDERKRTVSGYFASFDTVDSDNDVIRQGAFSKSIQEIGPESQGNRRIAHLRNHDLDRQIGKILELREDEKGLFFVSQMGTSTEGEDAFRDYQDGILREHSIGFNYISDKMEWINDIRQEEGGYWSLTELKLLEGSAVTFGANSLTPVIDIQKGENTNSVNLKKLNDLVSSLDQALRNGKGTDHRLENIELKLKQIKQVTKSLEEMKPAKATPPQEPQKSLLDCLLLPTSKK